MRRNITNMWVTVFATVFTIGALSCVLADDTATTANPASQKVYTGIVSAVDPQTHLLNVEGWTTLSKKFNFNDACSFLQLDKRNATATDLRVGEKVNVSYDEVNGSAVATRVEQEAMRFEGTVKEADSGTNTLVLHQTGLDKELLLPNDCQYVLHDGRHGTKADLEVGNHVVALYETPNKSPIARQIIKTSTSLTGTLTAVDFEKKTVTAKTAVITKTLVVGDNCVFALNGVKDGKLEDLKLNDRLVFSYDEVNGVEKAGRIASTEAPPNIIAVVEPPEDY